MTNVARDYLLIIITLSLLANLSGCKAHGLTSNENEPAPPPENVTEPLLTPIIPSPPKLNSPKVPLQLVKVVVENTGETTIASLTDNTSIILSPGVTISGATVAIRQVAPDDTPQLPAWANDVISVYDFTVTKPLQGTATIRIPIPDSKLAILGHYADGQWEAMPFFTEDARAMIEVEELGIFSWINFKSDWISEEIVKFLSSRFHEKKPLDYSNSDEGITIDNRDTQGLISGSAYYTNDNKIQATIYNCTLVHLDVCPARGEAVELTKSGVFVSAVSPGGTIIAPGSKAEWIASLLPGEDINFEAYFSEFCAAALFYELISTGGLLQGVLENGIFTRNGRQINWGDINSLLMLPTLAEFDETLEILHEAPILETGRINFKRID